ncbi:unnamed protein product [Cuscuta campestris]|uniref:Uncharacterized protein n=1 Tax=Cuscuta campestris TaxID=132261 RepID=A0A484M243_9ASTE|nr:unnamed protein product [Cuscuta campestris]
MARLELPLPVVVFVSGTSKKNWSSSPFAHRWSSVARTGLRCGGPTTSPRERTSRFHSPFSKQRHSCC